MTKLRLFCVLMMVAFSGSVFAEPAAPTKEAAVKLLNDFHAALVAKQWDKALAMYVTTNGDKDLTADQLAKAAPRLLERDLTSDGINALAGNGKWGKLKDVIPDAAGLTARHKLDPEQCYALVLGRANALYAWDGKAFKLFKVDDIVVAKPTTQQNQ